MTPLISIITPTYQRAEFIEEMLKSILVQTYSNWELILVDDGSTDNTVELIKPYLNDQRIKYHYQENNGQSSARKKAIQLAEGEYLAFLDSDNVWIPTRLELGLKAIESDPTIDLTYGDIVEIDIDSVEQPTQNMKRFSGAVAPELVKDNFITMNTVLVKKTAVIKVGAFRSEVKRADDYDMWLRLSAEHNFLYVPKIMVKYRVMDDQISSNKAGRFIANKEIVEHFHNVFPVALTATEKKQGWSSFYLRKAYYEMSVEHYSEAKNDIFKALNFKPLWIGPWKGLVKLVLLRLIPST